MAAPIMSMDALPIEDVGECWQNWQRAHPAEAAEITGKATLLMILKPRLAAANHICVVAQKTGIPKHLVSEYVRKHSMD